MLADRLLAERAADLRDVGRRVLGVLCDVTLPEPPDHPYILVMDDIGPSDVARLDTSVCAACSPFAVAPRRTALFWPAHWVFPPSLAPGKR